MYKKDEAVMVNTDEYIEFLHTQYVLAALEVAEKDAADPNAERYSREDVNEMMRKYL